MTIEQLRNALHARANTLVDPIVRGLARLGITADGMTYAGLAVSAAAAALLASGMLVAAGIVWLLGSALDMLDGALARATGAVKPRGAFLDSSLDRVSEGLLLTAAVYHFAGQGMALAAAMTAWALLASLMVSYTRARAEGLGAECKVGIATRVERVILLGLGLLLDALAIAVGAVAVLATVTTVQRLMQVRAALTDAGAAPPASRTRQD